MSGDYAFEKEVEEDGESNKQIQNRIEMVSRENVRYHGALQQLNLFDLFEDFELD